MLSFLSWSFSFFSWCTERMKHRDTLKVINIIQMRMIRCRMSSSPVIPLLCSTLEISLQSISSRSIISERLSSSFCCIFRNRKHRVWEHRDDNLWLSQACPLCLSIPFDWFAVTTEALVSVRTKNIRFTLHRHRDSVVYVLGSVLLFLLVQSCILVWDTLFLLLLFG